MLLIRVDEVFWNVPEYYFYVPLSLERPGNWERVSTSPLRTATFRQNEISKWYQKITRFHCRYRYVAFSRCTTLEGLYIVGKKISSEHYKKLFELEGGETKPEGVRLRRFHHGNILRKGLEAACMYCDGMTLTRMCPLCLLTMKLMMHLSIICTILK